MIFFDLDHTLLDLEGADKRALPRYLKGSVLREKLTWEDFYAAWEAIRIDCFQRYLDGEFSYDGQRTERMLRIHKKAGIDLSADEALAEFMRYHEILRSEWKLFPEAWIALRMLEGRKLGLITNGNATQQRDKLEILGLTHCFPYVLTAAEAGCAKPDPKIFLMACEAVGAAPKDCVYIGDSLTSDICPAASLGMKTVWVDRKHQAVPPDLSCIRVMELMGAAKAVLDMGE